MLRRTYVGVAHSGFDSDSPTFSHLLPLSVCVSLLGAGVAVSSFEAEGRHEEADFGADFSLGSRYGMVAVALRMAQIAALVFWIALVSCVQKGWGGLAIALSVPVYMSMVMEAASRSRLLDVDELERSLLGTSNGGIWEIVLVALHLGLIGGMAAVFFGHEKTQGWVGASVMLVSLLVGCCGCLFAGCNACKADTKSVNDYERGSKKLRRRKRATSLCCACFCAPLILICIGFVHAALIFGSSAFITPDKFMSGSGSGFDDLAYLDCRESGSGLYLAYLATALCVVLMPLYATLDPELGVECLRSKSRDEKNDEAERQMREEVIAKEADTPLEEQVKELWKWAKGTPRGLSVPQMQATLAATQQAYVQTSTADDLLVPSERRASYDRLHASFNPQTRLRYSHYLSEQEIRAMADFVGMTYGDLCELLEVQGPKPVRGARAVLGGRVGTVDLVGRLGELFTVWWTDDGTESGFISVTDLDEPLTSATNLAQQVEVNVAREDFIAWCTKNSERTEQMYLHIVDAHAKADAAVLEAKIAAVWRWADAAGNGALGPTELRRLADRVGEQYEFVAEVLGMDEMVAGGAISVEEEEFDTALRRNAGRPEGWFKGLGLALVGGRANRASRCFG
eukprot:COSAG04_NODE_1013_length_8768_cov_10.694544_4_plen_626_part_00